MRPIPAPRIGESHGLLRAISTRERLRLDEFVTEFPPEELFPPGLENAMGRTRQFVSYARSAGLLKEDRGTVELTEIGKRYVRAADDAELFSVSEAQADWLRRQLLEKHMTDSIFHGLAIGLSLLSSVAPGTRISTLDFGRALGYLGRAGWDNDNTLQSQGERYLALMRDMRMIDEQRGLTPTGSEVKGELTLPVHMSLLDIAGQQNPGGPEAVLAAGEAEWAQAEQEAAPAPESAPEPAAAPGAPVPGPEDDEEDEWQDVGPGAPPRTPAPAAAPPPAPAPAPAAAAPPTPPADIWETAEPDEKTSSYSAVGAPPPPATPPEPAPPAAPDEPAATPPVEPGMTAGDPLAARRGRARARLPGAAVRGAAPTGRADRDLEPGRAGRASAAAGRGAAAPAAGRERIPRRGRHRRRRRGSGPAPPARGLRLDRRGARGRQARRPHRPRGIGQDDARARRRPRRGHLRPRDRRRARDAHATAGPPATRSAAAAAPTARPRRRARSRTPPAAASGWWSTSSIARAPTGRSAGLSTFLGGLPVTLPGGEEVKPPAEWRVVATAAGPLEASPPLTRRFAHVEVPFPGDADLAALIDRAAGGDATAAAAARRLLALRELRPLGAGVFLDAANHAAERNAAEPADERTLAREVYGAYVEPLMGGLDDGARVRLRELLGAL